MTMQENQPTPKKPRQLTQAELSKRFPLAYKIAENRQVIVPHEWKAANLVFMRLPSTITSSVGTSVHKDAKPVFERWFKLLAERRLEGRLVTFDGGFVPRLKRGKLVQPNESGLSRHSRGIALDFNASWNPMGRPGPKAGEMGSTAELIESANECGIVCGADWHGASCDPMHFEIGVL